MDTDIDPFDLARQALDLGDEQSADVDEQAQLDDERMSETHYVHITTADLLLLDKITRSESVQDKIIEIRKRIALEDADYALHLPVSLRRVLADIVENAERDHHLSVCLDSTLYGDSCCEACQVSPGYDPYLRNGTYAVKGQPNHDKPRRMKAVWICETKLCMTCFEQIKKPLIRAMRGKYIQLDRELTGKNPIYEVRSYYTCTQCSWSGLPDDEGTVYADPCPSCKATCESAGTWRVLQCDWSRLAVVRVRDGKVVKNIDNS